MRNWRIIELINTDTFDFTWHPDETEGAFNYVFGNKFHAPNIMPTLMYKSKNAIGNKFCTDQTADLDIKTFIYSDSVYEELLISEFDTAYARFTKDNAAIEQNLKSSRIGIHIVGDDVFVPKNIKHNLYDKLTDYDYVVDHAITSQMLPLDIIFMSNGESCAEFNYEHLLKITRDLPNRVTRIDGVNGRIASQYAAANESKTPWYFLVNAKLHVRDNFDFSWKPDVGKKRLHYIFTATNSLNQLEYGHQAIVVNNKQLTLNTLGTGLDFTLESPHEVIDINSGVGMFNTSEWDAWRTAFREVIKLKCATDTNSKYRLQVWLTEAEGEFSAWCLLGAKDAENYYNSVNGEFSKLKLSYDWAWLTAYYSSVYLQNKTHSYV